MARKNVLSSKTDNSDWWLSLGMHNLRAAERGCKRDSKSSCYHVAQCNCTRSYPKRGGKIVRSRDSLMKNKTYGQVATGYSKGLPFSHPGHKAQKRRQGKKFSNPDGVTSGKSPVKATKAKGERKQISPREAARRKFFRMKILRQVPRSMFNFQNPKAKVRFAVANAAKFGRAFFKVCSLMAQAKKKDPRWELRCSRMADRRRRYKAWSFKRTQVRVMAKVRTEQTQTALVFPSKITPLVVGPEVEVVATEQEHVPNSFSSRGELGSSQVACGSVEVEVSAKCDCGDHKNCSAPGTSRRVCSVCEGLVWFRRKALCGDLDGHHVFHS